MVVLEDELMSKHTTFRIGGPAKCYCIVESKYELIELIKFLSEKQYKYYIIGHGSNLLVSDAGIDACIIEFGKEAFNKIQFNSNIVNSGANVSLIELCNKTQKKGLSGMEGLVGIPGNLGGAIYMNAGAYGTEMCNIVSEVTAINEKGEEIIFTNEECKFSYRYSIFQENKYIIISAKLNLQDGNKLEILRKMDQYKNIRKTNQPLDKLSAGSFFKRPKNGYAGQLIEEAQLKGYSIRGAQVSDKHCGFIINKGDATAKDIVMLMKLVQDQVLIYKGVKLEPEVQMWGEF